MNDKALYLYRCVHCRSITLLQIDDEQMNCECGAEFYPQCRRVYRGVRIPIGAVSGFFDDE